MCLRLFFEPPFLFFKRFFGKKREEEERPRFENAREGLGGERKMEKSRWLVAPFWLEREEEEERGADFTNVVFPLIPLLPLNVYACIGRRGSEERMIRQIFRENGGGEEGGKRASP